MPIWQKKRKQQTPPPAFCVQSVQTGQVQNPFAGQLHSGMIDQNANRLFEQIRQAVPVVDAAIGKIIRLVGGFTVVCDDSRVQRELDEFCARVQVGPSGIGLPQFLYGYLDDLLTYGNAAGEMVPLQSGEGLGALYNVPLDDLAVERGESPLQLCFSSFPDGVTPQPVPHPERILFSALNPAAGQIRGRSLLSGLPFVSSILLSIFQATGQNFERMGNLRFAVTYQPQGGVDGSYAREIAQDMARQWADTMRDGGQVKDFIAVGDVNIRVIGADNQVLDTQVPVRQMLEQIVAKLGPAAVYPGAELVDHRADEPAAGGDSGKRAGKLPRAFKRGNFAHLPVPPQPQGHGRRAFGQVEARQHERRGGAGQGRTAAHAGQTNRAGPCTGGQGSGGGR